VIAKTDEDSICNFLEKTSALAISGYQKDINFIPNTITRLDPLQ
tara:strand:- start:912 stop:1043 length:132 start_codon:yes stop_codon:yes gene_type:complete